MSAEPSLTGQCGECGVTAPRSQLVEIEAGTRCPTCAPYEGRDFGRTKGDNAAFELLLILAAFGYLAASEASGAHSTITRMIVAACVIVSLTIIHELGHAVAAQLVGLDFVGIVLGHGPRQLTRMTLGQRFFEIRGNPTGGRTYAIGSVGRVRESVYLLAGVVAEVVVALVVLMWDPGTDTGVLIRTAVLIFVAYSVIANWWPRHIEMPPYGWTPNDGQLVRDLWGSEQRSEPSEITPAMIADMVSAETLTPEAIAQKLADNFADSPDNPEVRAQYGLSLIGEEQWRKAVDVMAPLADATEFPDQAFALLCNNMAWSALMTFDPELVASAETWSAKAEALLPIMPAISSTRGSALVMAGRATEGLPLLARAYRTCGDAPRELALVSGFGALAHAQLGNAAQARRRYTAMVTHDPECSIRRQVEARIAEAEVITFAALIADQQSGELDTSEMAQDELDTLPALADLTLAWVNGVCSPQRLLDSEVIRVNNQAVKVSAIRVAARRVAEAQQVTASS